jgi:hypothetical protein
MNHPSIGTLSLKERRELALGGLTCLAAGYRWRLGPVTNKV